ncbi:hypothetical protein SB778_31585 [Paraburkholderia sp. SIMBA_050]
MPLSSTLSPRCLGTTRRVYQWEARFLELRKRLLARGGKVSNVAHSQVCMRNVGQPLVLDPFYSSPTGKTYPNFTGITISGLHYLGSTKCGGGHVTFEGYKKNSQMNPLVITLVNVAFDSKQPTFDKDIATHYALGPRSRELLE